MAPINTYRRRMAVPIGSRATSGHYSVLRRRGQAATGRLNVRITRGQAPDTAGPDTDDSVSDSPESPHGAGDPNRPSRPATQSWRCANRLGRVTTSLTPPTLANWNAATRALMPTESMNVTCCMLSSMRLGRGPASWPANASRISYAFSTSISPSGETSTAPLASVDIFIDSVTPLPPPLGEPERLLVRKPRRCVVPPSSAARRLGP